MRAVQKQLKKQQQQDSEEEVDAVELAKQANEID